MEETIRYKNRLIVFSLTWKDFNLNHEDKKSVIDYFRYDDRSSGVLHTSGEYLSLGLSAKKKGYSFAAILACEYQHGIFALEIKSGLFSLVHVSDGLVVTLRDVVANKQEAMAIVEEWLKFSVETPLFGDASLYPAEADVQATSLKKILNSTKKTDGKINKLSFLFAFRFYKSHIASTLLLLLVCLLLAINYLEDLLPEEKPDVAQLTVAELEQVRWNSFYDKHITPLRVKPKAKTWITDINSAISSLPIYVNGWEIKNIVCLAIGNECTVTYNATSLATNASFEEEFKDNYATNYSISGKTAKLTIKLPNIDNASEISDENFYNNLYSSHEYLVNLPMQAILSSGLITYTASDAKPNEARYNLFLHRWNMKGDLLYYMQEATSYLGGDYFFSDKVTINFTKDSESWLAEGVYVTK